MDKRMHDQCYNRDVRNSIWNSPIQYFGDQTSGSLSSHIHQSCAQNVYLSASTYEGQQEKKTHRHPISVAGKRVPGGYSTFHK